MSYSIRELKKREFPALLNEIPDPPKKLYCAGVLPPPENKILCIVGSRKYTSYGEDACENIIAGLERFPITIVSGLALGMDGIAHKMALKYGLHALAIPGSGISPNAIHPRTNFLLAREILEAGGALLSEFEPEFRPALWTFPQRNRIMAGLSHATLIIEAGEKSGTLITARLALDYNREVLVVPGSIFSDTSKGSNELLRHGAEPATSTTVVLRALGFSIEDKKERDLSDLSPEELRIVELLSEPMNRDDLIRELGVSTGEATMILSSLELRGIIKESLGEVRLV